MRRGEFQLKDVFDLFNAEWERSPVPAHARCFECGRPAVTILALCGEAQPVCESCSSDMAETLLAEAV